MTIKIKTTYIINNRDSLEFIPVEKAPGFTHRVVLNGLAIDWLTR